MFKSKIQHSLHVIRFLCGQVNPVTVDILAERLKLSHVYIEQLVRVLRDNKILKGKRGPGGGYVLNEHLLAFITLAELAKMFDIPDTNFLSKKIGDMTISEVLEI